MSPTPAETDSAGGLQTQIDQVYGEGRVADSLDLRYRMAAVLFADPPDNDYDAIRNWVEIGRNATYLGRFGDASRAHAVAIHLMRRTTVPNVAYVPRQVAASSAIAFATGQHGIGLELLRLAEREMIDAQGGDQIVSAAHTALLYAREIQNLARPSTAPSTDSQAVNVQVATYMYELGAGLLTCRVTEESRIEPSDVFVRAGQIFATQGQFGMSERCYGAAGNFLRDNGRSRQAHMAYLQSALMGERLSPGPKYTTRYWAAGAALSLEDRRLFADATDIIPVASIDDPHYFVMFVFLESEMIRLVDKDRVRAAQYVDDHLPRALELTGYRSTPDDMPNATSYERATIPYLGALFANRLPLATATESSRITDAVTAARLYARGIRDDHLDQSVSDGGGHERNLELLFRDLARYTYSGAAVLVARDQALDYVKGELQDAALEQFSEMATTAANNAYDFAVNLISGFGN
ncbi:hypothetical protein CHR55_29675 [Rhodococcus qingshengii]|uniref:Uncharacterized protein n=1 Tax=Rhodococcus qingshengii TaxID=334542 RepID=A0A2A5J205_RHOSG|nr:hypothetical protein CHR55_29675 [Rhodococcus qingshengii]